MDCGRFDTLTEDHIPPFEVSKCGCVKPLSCGVNFRGMFKDCLFYSETVCWPCHQTRTSCRLQGLRPVPADCPVCREREREKRRKIEEEEERVREERTREREERKRKQREQEEKKRKRAEEDERGALRGL